MITKGYYFRISRSYTDMRHCPTNGDTRKGYENEAAGCDWNARLEANAPGGCIYISRAVADALEGRIRVTSLGDTIKLKGKKEGFEILTMDEIL